MHWCTEGGCLGPPAGSMVGALAAFPGMRNRQLALPERLTQLAHLACPLGVLGALGHEKSGAWVGAHGKRQSWATEELRDAHERNTADAA